MPRKREFPSGFESAINRYLAHECSTTDIALEFSIAKSTALNWMNSLGVRRHPPGEMISIKMAGKKLRLGAKHSDEAKAKIRASRIGKETTLGFKFSEESKKKMSISGKIRAATTDSMKKMRAGIDKNRMPEHERIARQKARAACKRMVRRILTMARAKKDGRRSELLLGYTKDDLRKHLEAQFRDGMSWEKRGSFHIDHIKPVAQFFKEGIYSPFVINALDNLQALTPEENRKKSDYFDDGAREFA